MTKNVWHNLLQQLYLRNDLRKYSMIYVLRKMITLKEYFYDRST